MLTITPPLRILLELQFHEVETVCQESADFDFAKTGMVSGRLKVGYHHGLKRSYTMEITTKKVFPIPSLVLMPFGKKQSQG